MTVSNPKIEKLRKIVKAAHQEFDHIVAFHETWKPSAYDEALKRRMSESYAQKAFSVVRVALRREMLLALARLWDKRRGTLRMQEIANHLGDARVVDTLAWEKADRMANEANDANMPLPISEDQFKQITKQSAEEVVESVDKYYTTGSSHWAVREEVKKLPNEHLAHRQVEPTAILTGANATDKDVETFYARQF